MDNEGVSWASNSAHGNYRDNRLMYLVCDTVGRFGDKGAFKAEVYDYLVNQSPNITAEETAWARDNKDNMLAYITRAAGNLRDYHIFQTGLKYRLSRIGRLISTQEELAEFTQEEPPSGAVKESWQQELLDNMRSLTPGQFEHLIALVLSHSGVSGVEVTGRPNDGGIDGIGNMVAGLKRTIPVVFQAKRYSGTLGSSAVRDFKGAMTDRAHVGMLITTGQVSKDARREAERTKQFDLHLMDGAELCDWLKEKGIGVEVKTRTLETVRVDPLYWQGLPKDSN